MRDPATGAVDTYFSVLGAPMLSASKVRGYAAKGPQLTAHLRTRGIRTAYAQAPGFSYAVLSTQAQRRAGLSEGKSR